MDFIAQPHSFDGAPAFRELTDLLGKLDDVLYGPIAQKVDELNISRVCIIPHRILHVLPLNLLGYSRTGSYLAQRFILSFCPSLLSFHHLNQSPQGEIRKALIVADPVSHCPGNVCRNVSRDCFSIAGAAEEGKSLRSRLELENVETKYFVSSAATLDAVMSELPDANIAHFASHGFFNPSVPEKSGILLNSIADCSKKNRLYLQHNGELSLNSTNAVGEVLSLDYLWEHVDMFNCKFLNLSACSTAMIDWTERSDEFYASGNTQKRPCRVT